MKSGGPIPRKSGGPITGNPAIEMRDLVSSSRGCQRMYPEVGGRKFKPSVWVLWMSPDGGGVWSGGYRTKHPEHLRFSEKIRALTAWL